MGCSVIIVEDWLLPVVSCQWWTVPCLLCWGQAMQTGMASLLHFWPAHCLFFLSTCINSGSFVQVFMYSKINTISQHSFWLLLGGIINKHFSFIPIYSFCIQEILNTYKKEEECHRSLCSRSFGFQTLKLASLGKGWCLPVEGRRKWNNPVEKEKRNIFPSLLDYIPSGLSRSLYCILNVQ